MLPLRMEERRLAARIAATAGALRVVRHDLVIADADEPRAAARDGFDDRVEQIVDEAVAVGVRDVADVRHELDVGLRGRQLVERDDERVGRRRWIRAQIAEHGEPHAAVVIASSPERSQCRRCEIGALVLAERRHDLDARLQVVDEHVMKVADVGEPVPRRAVRRIGTQIGRVVGRRRARVHASVDLRVRRWLVAVRREREPDLRRRIGAVRQSHSVRHAAMNAAVERHRIARRNRGFHVKRAIVSKVHGAAHREQRHVQRAVAVHVRIGGQRWSEIVQPMTVWSEIAVICDHVLRLIWNHKLLPMIFNEI